MPKTKTSQLEQTQEQIQLILNKQADIKAKFTATLPYVGIILLFVFFSFSTNGKFFQKENFEILLAQCYTIVMVIMGCAFLYSAGGLDMAIGAVMSIGILVMAMAVTVLNIPIFLAFLLALAVTIIGMSITAVARNQLNLDPFIASLCVLNAGAGIVQSATAKGTIYLPYSIFAHLNTPIVKITVMIVVFCIGFILFNYTRVGKSLKAIGGNINVAKISGINDKFYIWIAYVLAGVTLAIAGFFSMLRVGIVDTAAGGALNLNVITAVVLGGTPLAGGANSKFLSPVLGGLMVAILSNGLALMGYANAVGFLFKGILFLVIVSLTYERSKGKLIS